jgi:hypothetical protein
MLAVTESGSVAAYFRNLDVKVGAKYRSAQVSTESASNAVFVAFALTTTPRSLWPSWWKRAAPDPSWEPSPPISWPTILPRRMTQEAVVTENVLLR